MKIFLEKLHVWKLFGYASEIVNWLWATICFTYRAPFDFRIGAWGVSSFNKTVQEYSFSMAVSLPLERCDTRALRYYHVVIPGLLG